MNYSPDGGFDIEPPAATSTPVAAVVPPAFMLTSDKVRSVRFYESKPGYEFRQVETFVEQVVETLAFLELALFKAQADAHEKAEDAAELQGIVANLKMTIELFRAKGDPVVAADGSYVTESQLAASQDMDALRTQLAEAHAQIAALAGEREALHSQLAAAQQTAEQGWAVEASLRRYIDEELLPWAAAQAAQAPEVISAANERAVPPVAESAVTDPATRELPEAGLSSPAEDHNPAPAPTEAPPGGDAYTSAKPHVTEPQRVDPVDPPSPAAVDGAYDPAAAEPSAEVDDEEEYYARLDAAVQAMDAGIDPEPILRGEIPIDAAATAVKADAEPIETAAPVLAGANDHAEPAPTTTAAEEPGPNASAEEEEQGLSEGPASPAEPDPSLAEPTAAPASAAIDAEHAQPVAPATQATVPADAAAALAELTAAPAPAPRRSLLESSPEAQAAGADIAAPNYDEQPLFQAPPRRSLLESSPEAQAAAASTDES